MGNTVISTEEIKEFSIRDETLVSSSADDLCDEAYLKTFSNAIDRVKKIAKFELESEVPADIFVKNGECHTAELSQKIMLDISRLTHDPSVSRSTNSVLGFTLSLESQFAVIKQIHSAVLRETQRGKKRLQASSDALKSRRDAAAPPLSSAAKLGIKSVVRTLLLLMKAVKQKDEKLIPKVLDLTADLLKDAPPLSLVDGPNFSPDIAEAISPWMDFLRSMATPPPLSSTRPPSHSTVACAPLKDAPARCKAARVLFGVALARGSLLDLLALVDIFLAGRRCTDMDGAALEYPLVDMLETLRAYDPVQKSPPSPSSRGSSSRILSGVRTPRSDTETKEEGEQAHLTSPGSSRLSLASPRSSDIPASVRRSRRQSRVSIRSDASVPSVSFTHDAVMRRVGARLIPAPVAFTGVGTARGAGRRSVTLASLPEFSATSSAHQPEQDAGAVAFPSAGAEGSAAEAFAVRLDCGGAGDWASGGESQQRPVYGVDGLVAAVVMMTQLDRLTQGMAPPKSSDITESALSARLAVLTKPMCIEVRPETFSCLLSILKSVSMEPRTVEGRSDDNMFFRAYITVSALRILKIHFYQLTLANLGHPDFALSGALLAELRAEMFRLVRSKLPHYSQEANVAIQDEATQVLSSGFEVFFPSLIDQIDYLSDLLVKHLDTKSVPETGKILLELLLNRFSAFHTGAMVVDDILGNVSTPEKKQAARVSIVRVMTRLMESCEARTLRALEEDAELSVESGGALRVLGNFQRHLISRAAKIGEDGNDEGGIANFAQEILQAYAIELFKACSATLTK
eukprot:98602_1